jgi:hypothetical protein
VRVLARSPALRAFKNRAPSADPRKAFPRAEGLVQKATDELRHFTRQRTGVLVELGACACAALALWAVAGRLDEALPEANAAFLAVAGLFGAGLVRLVGQLVPVLAFRCPRCDHLFHADGTRRALRLRACAHCGLTASSETTGV